MASTKIKAIAKENEKIIWIFLYDNEAIRYNLKNKTHKLLRLNDSLNISQLLFNKSKNIGNNIYIVSSAGLLKYDLKINELQIFQENKSDDIITDFIVAQNKSFIWVLKNNGNLIQQNIHNDNIQIINLEEKLNKKINTTTFCYSNGKLFIASKNNGLIIYNIQSNEAEVFPFLSRNYEIKTILATDNFIWFSTNYTISRFNLKTKEYSHTDARLLFDNTHYNYNAGLLIDDTTIAMGGKLGLNIFTEGEIIHNKTKYNIITSDIKLYNQSLFYRNDKQLDTLPYYSDEITFHYNQKIFSIEFSLLSFNDPQEIKYAYLLEGLTDKWAYLGKNNKATFSHLPPGKYNLVVKGKDPYGYWHKNKALKINIPPPFWMESWFIITSVCFIILILGFSFYLRGRKTRQLNKKLQRMVKERTSEILEKNEELSVQNEKIEEQKVELEKLNLTKDRLFSIIAHDLKNPFNAISGFAALLLNNYDDYSDQQKTELIRMIQTSSHNAYEMLQNLLHWSRANLNVISFNPKIINIKEIVDENLKFFNIIAKEKKITLSAETKDVKAYADKDLINTVIRNLIANALKFTKKNGKITIEYENDDNSVIIRVIDTGIGIPQESQDKLFYMDNKYSTEGTEGEKGTGIGLVLCKEFTEKNNGTIELQSKVGEGTTFIVKLPKSGDN